MSESEDDSGSGSDSSSSHASQTSERRKAARDRLAPKTQLDYASIISCVTQFALDNRATLSHCIESGTNKIFLPVPLALGEAYLCHLRDKLVPWPHDSRPVETRTGLKHYSKGIIDNTVHAIKYSFTKLSRPIPHQDGKFYNDFQHSYKHILAAAKALGAYPASAGTVPITRTAMIKLLEASMKYVPSGKGHAESSVQHLWLFLLMSIATCGRGERVSRIQFACMAWFSDVATVQIPTSKSDTIGAMSYAKMCSANPLNPLCCMITALGVEFLTRASNSSFQFLFGDAGDATHYMVTKLQTAMKLVQQNVGEDVLGAPLHRLTGHFLKKTSLAMMRSNHECISHDSRELRADHKVGPYNLRSEQDGVVGRILAFLVPGKEEFSVAPPHFHPNVVSVIPWALLVPGYELYSSDTRQLIHASVASVIHNIDFLKKNLSLSHPFHGCRLLHAQSRWINLLQPYVLGGRSGFKSVMDPTGQSLVNRMSVDLQRMAEQVVTVLCMLVPLLTLHHRTPPYTTANHHTPPHATKHQHTPPHTA
jgi:hypothetical protein